MRSLHHSYPNRNDPRLPVHPWSALGSRSRFEHSEMRAKSALRAFAVENSVVNGGS